jgi:hypothetical protein
MTGLRAALVVLAGAVCAPTITAAQPQTQMAVLADIMALCTDKTVMIDDWPDVLVDWDLQSPPPERITDAYLSSDILVGLAADGVLTVPVTPLDRLGLLADFQRDFDYDKQSRSDNPEEVYEAFYQHASGWVLALDVHDDDLASTFCVIWHMDPDDAVLAHLTAPYIGFDPVEIDMGTYAHSRLVLPDQPNLASLSVGVLAVDPAISLPSPVLSQHPIRFLPAVSVEIFYTAYSRETD